MAASGAGVPRTTMSTTNSDWEAPSGCGAASARAPVSTVTSASATSARTTLLIRPTSAVVVERRV